MSALIRHRGPDDDGILRDDAAGLALAFRRLSIIDLSAASHQPMRDGATGVSMAFNGEIYNFRELREQLRGLGHAFVSTGDGEVLLKAYLQWGIACLERLCGMFALALWDPRTRVLHLARDPMGMKPLYWTPVRGGIAFASELKAFAAIEGLVLWPSQRGLTQYMEFGYVFDEQETIFEGVHKLAPGSRIEFAADGERRNRQYFLPPACDESDRRAEAERVDELEQTLSRVVREHLVADVPLGLLLSGGLDSSVVAALAAREGPLLTISMGFDSSAIDERPLARQVAAHVGSNHLEVLITPAQVMAEVESGAWVFDDLFADWGTVTTRLLYRQCRERGVKAVLVGEGADELFGGYDVFRLPARLGLWQRFRLYQRYSGRRHGRLFGDFNAIIEGYLQESGGDAFDAVRRFESCRQLPNQYVMKVDKASMAESLEARAPYLDRRVAELAFRTPSAWLLRDGENKYLLRALARRNGLLPEAIGARGKFGAPLAASWMDDNREFRAFARERILSGQWAARFGLTSAMRDYFDKGTSGYGFPSPLSVLRNVAWRLLLLELWSGHFLGKKAA